MKPKRTAALPIVPALGMMVSLLGGCVPPVKPGDPLPGLTEAERKLFEKGRRAVEREFTPETGLGPLFNAPACAECHEAPTVGGGGDEVELHLSRIRDDGSCDPLADRGGPVVQAQVTPALRRALGVESEPIPPEATGRGNRSTPDLLGFGLLDAVPESVILSHADPDDRDGDGVSGRPNRFVDGRQGRFGRKGFVPTLSEFNAGAFVVEQGITNPAVPAEELVGGVPIPPGVDPLPEPEIDQQTLDAADAFVRFLAPPAPAILSPGGRRGRDLFRRVGCTACHVPVLKTGDSPVRALRHQEVAAYTDLLLHDMGADLADMCLGLATPSEFRTEPLMGLHLMSSFLHDGRAKTVEEAILLHGGEATRSRRRFAELSDSDRAALIMFLGSL